MILWQSLTGMSTVLHQVTLEGDRAVLHQVTLEGHSAFLHRGILAEVVQSSTKLS